MNELVGRGWAFPVRASSSGTIALVSQDREVEESIRMILGTAFGERPMRPDFGCAIHDRIFDPVDAGLAGVLAHEVTLSLERWEPRIELIDVDVSFDRDDAALVYIEIRYRISDVLDPRTLVFPFYTIPEES